MRVALKLAYLGSEYYGYQIQPGVPTIEGKILKALRETGALRNPAKARYSAAGRTDRGVHALGQVIAFDTDYAAYSKPAALNCGLHHIWVYARAEVGTQFNARKSALEREYRYIFHGKGLDIGKMQEALSMFNGTHDFRNFADEDKEKSTLCDIKGISIMEEGGWFYLDVRAGRFLQHMVRKMAASLNLIGKHEKDMEWLGKMLDGSIKEKLEPLDARGLILMDVKYPDVRWNADEYARRKALEEINELYTINETSARILSQVGKGMQLA